MTQDKISSSLPERRLILLENDKDPSIRVLKEILKSTLNLAKIIICLSFSEASPNLLSIKEKLDSIKKMAAGLASAEKKTSYKIANYAVYLFAFQQFFHSSYRARQGNVLEKLVRRFFLDLGIQVYKKGEHKKVLKSIGIEMKRKSDIDIVAFNEPEYILIQMRSRDDTGGTTAKGSLVELLRDTLRNRTIVKSPVLYIIYVWEPLQEGQKRSLINKVLGELQDYVDIAGLAEKLNSGNSVEITKNIRLQLSYGPEQFANILFKDSGLKKEFEKIMEFAGKWDDLWLSYAIASLELERMVIKEKSNFQILDEKLRLNNIMFNHEDFQHYLEASKKYAMRILPYWVEDTIPLTSPSEQFIYIRDLILLKMIYQKIRNECPLIVKSLKEKGV